MKHAWLIKKSGFFTLRRRKLILFFNGWANDPTSFKHLSSNAYDVLMFYDYKNLSLDDLILKEWKKYKNITVIGWSMGVWAANHFGEHLQNAAYCIAVNGTFQPINDKYGIPKPLFYLTLNNFIPVSRERFYKNMFSNKEDMQKFIKIQPQREFDEQKEELKALQGYIENGNGKHCLNINKAIIGKHDKIIPANNQIAFWKKHLEPIIVDAGHYPFFMWESWEELIDYAGK